ncbi:protein kinase [Vitiosangium sp. GDMCC 1.1324]|uniref:protein kinase domain-containing protein n=1 Tax=Vitiosangium sp. (strain GDMCC 1.1324) TaxID=2138576 RepID=UPI000D3C78DB|nr:protein kinase [Vitiosangium sp. GDMCC 1.1324]PTL84552.1 serine/threonine protein kinase [Vitiosangium sp. GDMCC 1.1324]
MQQVGKYQLIRKLATGGMAEVFLAKAAGPMGFEKTLVLKRILPHLAEEPAFVEMFLSEAKLAAQLTHPHIVQIFDFGEADGAYFLAMEYIDGPNLRTLVKRAAAQGMSLPMAACARLITHACEGLAFAHDFIDPETGEALGLIHRDISPDNILLSKQGAVKVVDFGIAKAAGQSHKTRSGVIKGKLAYMSPEQVRAESLDRRADVYALGVVLYELLTAHKPIESESDVGLIQAILAQAPTPAAQLRPELPDSLRHILDRALAKDREQRYPDCHAFQSDLEDFILSTGKPVTTQQIAQLIAQVASGTDQPMLQPGTPPGGPKRSATPVHTPAPSSTKTDVETAQAPGTVKTRRPQGPTQGSHEALSEFATVPDAGPPPRATPPSAQVPARVQESPVETHPRRGRWVPALVGVVLLALGGGFLLRRTAFSAPEPQPEPLVAQRKTQPETSPSTTPPSGTSPSTTPQSVTPPSTGSSPSAPAELPADSSGVRPQDNSDAGSVAAMSQDVPPAPGGSSAEQKAPPPESSPIPVPPPRPSVPAKKPKSPPQVASKPVLKGKIEFRVRPYATVFVNGKELGDTPMEPVEWPVGVYTVKLVNKGIQKTVFRSIEVTPDKTTVVKVNLLEE